MLVVAQGAGPALQKPGRLLPHPLRVPTYNGVFGARKQAPRLLLRPICAAEGLLKRQACEVCTVAEIMACLRVLPLRMHSDWHRQAGASSWQGHPRTTRGTCAWGQASEHHAVLQGVQCRNPEQGGLHHSR